MVTITDVSKRAGVSRSTVSRVVAGNGYVSEEKRRAIQEAIVALGYRPNTMAQALRSNRSNMIGAVVVDVGTPFYADMVGGIQAACRTSGKSLLVSSGFANQDEEARAIIELVDRSCDGLVLYLEHPVRDDVNAILRGAEIPLVIIGIADSPVSNGAVLIDNFGGGAQGMRHLLELGHRRIAYLSGQLAYRDTRNRLAGIAATVPDYGMTMDDVYVVNGEYSEVFGFNATETLLSERPDITAIFAGDDDIAAGALLALKRHGRRIPQDISLVGFDDNFHARHLTPALTTVRQPVFLAGQTAAEMLLTFLAGDVDADARPADVIVPTELVLRDTTSRVTQSPPEKVAM